MSPTPPTPPDRAADAASDDVTADPGAARARTRGLGVTVGAVVALLLLAGGLAVWALTGDDGSDATASDHGDHSAGAGHAGHDEQVLEGCDPEAYHNTMMMFDPTAADGLLDSGCPWPYEATITVEGGTEDPSIDAAFEPHRYADVFEIVTTERFGMCSVATLPDERVDGFVFGFGVALNPAGCADNVATVQVDIREYASRAWRDTAANAAVADGTAHVLVLGRWVIKIGGDDAEGAARFASLLEPLGAVTV